MSKLAQLRAQVGAKTQDSQSDRLQLAFNKSNHAVKTPTIDPAIVQMIVELVAHSTKDANVCAKNVSTKDAKEVIGEAIAEQYSRVLKKDLPDPNNPTNAKPVKPTVTVAGAHKS